MKYTSVREIEAAEKQHRFAIADFLRSRGWKETNDLPGFVEAWTREWQGAKLMASESLAVEMQGNIDATDPDRICPDCNKTQQDCECIPF